VARISCVVTAAAEEPGAAQGKAKAQLAFEPGRKKHGLQSNDMLQ
jgi:hypothetical protein